MSITTHLAREMHDDLVDLRRQLHRDDSVLWQAAAWLAETALRRCALTA